MKLITQITKFQLPGTLLRSREDKAHQQQVPGSPWEFSLQASGAQVGPGAAMASPAYPFPSAFPSVHQH